MPRKTKTQKKWITAGIKQLTMIFINWQLLVSQTKVDLNLN